MAAIIGPTSSGTPGAPDAYNAACLAGLGLIQAPEIGVREHLARGVLVEVLPRYRPEPMSL
jgi:DNA-binding transcriptional LysR family regulator